MNRLIMALGALVVLGCKPEPTGLGSPTDPPGPPWPGTALSVAAGEHVTCAIGTDNAQWCWGNTLDAQFPLSVDGSGCAMFGLPAYEWPCIAAVPVRVGSHPLASIQLWNAGSPPCGMDAAGAAWCWAARRYVELPANAVNDGAGFYTCDGVPCSTQPRKVKAPGPLLDYTHVVLKACAVTTAGAIYCMGGNGYGSLGNPAFPNGSYDSLVAVASPAGLTFRSVRLGRLAQFGCALTTGGLAYCWGENDQGQLGSGNVPTARNVPTAVSGGRGYSAIALGARHACAISNAGPTYCWGFGVMGILGNGSTFSTDAPVLVSGNHTFTSITAGNAHTCALDAAGAAWCWGGDDLGQLGVDWSTTCPGASGVVHCSLVPAQVGGGLTFKQISAGTLHTCGVSTSNEVWCWGSANYGELGDGYSGAGSLGSASTRPRKVVAQ